MSFEMNRRKLMQVAAGSAAVFAFGSASKGFAQESTPVASPATTGAPTISVVEGPGEDELTITHAQGEAVIKKNPEKIVSFDVAAIETIEFLGGTLAGIPELSGDHAFTSTDAEIVGSLFEPDYEAINALGPDLIIIAGRSAEAYPELNKIAPTIDVTFGQDMIASFNANTSVLGTIVDNVAGADQAIADTQAHVDTLKAATADAGSAMVIMVSAGSVTALAPGNARGGRGALIYGVLGMKPPVDDLETATHGEPISFEFLLEHNPDWLFVIDRDQATGESEGQPANEVLDNDIIHQTTAWTEEQIVYVDPFDWYIITGASVPSMERMLGELDVAFGL